MGFTPGLRRESIGVGSEFSFLASEHTAVRRAGVTLDAILVDADGDGNKILMAGTVLGKIEVSGKYGPYDNAAADGRELAAGFLMHDVNLIHGDVVESMLEHGGVIVPRTSGLDSNARTDLAGRFFYVE